MRHKLTLYKQQLPMVNISRNLRILKILCPDTHNHSELKTLVAQMARTATKPCQAKERKTSRKLLILMAGKEGHFPLKKRKLEFSSLEYCSCLSIDQAVYMEET